MLKISAHYVCSAALLVLGVMVLMTTYEVSAADHTGPRQHSTHLHGIAQMNLGVDGANVFLELVSPAMNIVGFEHQPSTAEQRNAVLEAADKLEDGSSLFAFSKDAGCTLVSATIDSSLFAHERDKEHVHDDSHEEHHDEENDRKESHDKHHDEGAPDEHHHHSASESHGTPGHSEFKASYQFTCASPKKLKVLEVTLFSVFPGLKQLNSQILTTSGQTGAKLSAGNYQVDL